ncbi:bifunctional diaminohydroxyphosphoribosylaminopyrimidine deaminase/5-amino-6-(5-phosphoribosylamino)uracil reductase RibD [Aliidiomarina sanyensis]|nr:bifunctional diaminohydroxyphosphoribosylaminopyrimidine deaminase/5-amino-6-(5-phosphoribosylamino)uracil reductase RibD [Aliidiomarina sanyensis]
MTTNFDFSPADFFYMRRALMLARYGRFTTHPNPNVGCVIVRSAEGRMEATESAWIDAIVGEGYHARAGEPHAEVHALRAAGEKVKGATAYVTLEPCSHFGRTPPCANALIEAGVSRVVVAMRDPFPEVAGQGIQRLKDAGIQVDVGLCEDEAYAVSRGFFTRVEKQRPLVLLKLATTLDGKIALANGESKWVTSPEARADVQLGRAEAGAILTGARTVLLDDPTLNVRPEQFPEGSVYGDFPVRQPVRVVLDARVEVPMSAKLLQDGAPVWLIRTQSSGQTLPDHVEEIVVQGDGYGRIDLHALMAELAQRQIHTVWVEAGARLAGALVQADLVDDLILYQAPKFFGPDGLNGMNLPTVSDMQAVVSWQIQGCTRVGPDIKLVLQHPKTAT